MKLSLVYKVCGRQLKKKFSEGMRESNKVDLLKRALRVILISVIDNVLQDIAKEISISIA